MFIAIRLDVYKRQGKGLLKQKLSEIVDIFVKAGYEVVIYPTQAYRDAYRKITEMTEDYDLVVCSGGDGTIDEVVTGMMEREHKIPVGYIPTGTTKDVYKRQSLIRRHLLPYIRYRICVINRRYRELVHFSTRIASDGYYAGRSWHWLYIQEDIGL